MHISFIPASLLLILTVASLRTFAADTPSATPTDTAIRRDWIDPATGHRVIRLSPDSGGSSLYFHQNAYTPEGDKMILRGVVEVSVNGIDIFDIFCGKRTGWGMARKLRAAHRMGE